MNNKIIVYQIFTRLYGNRNTSRKENGSIEENGCGKLNDLTPTVLKKIRNMGVSHVWYTGVIRHATQTDYSDHGIPVNHPAVVKGKAGSPYAITDYYDIDPDLATDVDLRMLEFEQLVERTHQAGMKVIIDFVPNHVARQYHSICKPEGVRDLGEDDNPQHGFDPQNNFYYCPGQSFSPYFDLYHGAEQPYHEEPAKATGNDCFHHAPGVNDWYETVKLNYGVDYYAGRIGHFQPIPDTWDKMTDILLFWAGKGIDGFRCDMAEMVPTAFWHWAIDKVKYRYPEIIFVGEVYDPNQYRSYLGAGFDYLYDKVGMYDTLRGVMGGGLSTHAITSAWQQTDDIRDHMLFFLENHDEQRIASDFFVGDARKGVPALVVSALLQQNPLMVYAGQEYGERGMDQEGFSGRDGRTTIFDYWCIDTLVRAAQRKLTAEEKVLKAQYDKVLNIARSEKSIVEGDSFDLMYVNGQYQRQYAFLRKADSEVLLVVVNFDDLPVVMDVMIPAHAFDFLNMKEKGTVSTDLLTGERIRLQLQRDMPVVVSLKPLGAVIMKFKA
ncbi:Glycosidase [Prevotella aff. ruminicola Tc2-24]|uniref:Glycosidase n=1 Tax=Prevotella aff. ruminicola Tc2-24 TaxID=81582 RepID=A0A1I0LWR1_9BACT|nr:Glycosidase [Prevotella aff. ruminicola Tc2-24]